MQTLSLADKSLQTYFLIYLSSKGVHPIAQQWSLGKLISGLQPWVTTVADLLIKKRTPVSKTEKYIASRTVRYDSYDDLCQDINYCLLFILRKQKIESDRLYDFMYLVLRELFNGRTYGLSF